MYEGGDGKITKLFPTYQQTAKLFTLETFVVYGTSGMGALVINVCKKYDTVLYLRVRCN